MSSEPLCVTCGTQYPAPRTGCPICEDERQYIPVSGQQWTIDEGAAQPDKPWRYPQE